MSPGDGADRKATPERMTQHGKDLHRNVNEYLQLAWNNLQGARGIITGAMALDIGWQKAHGNDAALDDFKNGLRDASDNMVWGTISRLERTATAALMKVGGGTPLGRNAPALRMPSPAGNPARSGGSLGTSGVWTGGNITDHFAGAAGDRNKRDEGLFEDPPAE